MTRTKKIWLILISCATVLALTGVLLWIFVFNNPPRRLTLEFDADRVASINYGRGMKRYPITDSEEVARIVDDMIGQEFIWIGEIPEENDAFNSVETYLLDKDENLVWNGEIVDTYTIRLGNQVYRALGEGINEISLKSAAGLVDLG